MRIVNTPEFRAKCLASPSVDRIDIHKGYVRGNIRMVVWAFNAARGSWGDEALQKLIHALVKTDGYNCS